MSLITESVTYFFLFLALYFEVFMLLTYFEGKELERVSPNPFAPLELKRLPSVSVIVPAWNEENTILKTIFSILKLNYPKDKLKIYIVDDGSTDNTWSTVQRFSNNKQITLLQKENGGKHTALNYALQNINTDLVGCLDADSFVDPEALNKIVRHFQNLDVMAVTPSIKLFEPKGILPLLQKAEYIFGVFIRKVFSYMNAIYITPGPFSIFRRSVFDKIGFYKHAHTTEDMELAMRMQRNRMKIANEPQAIIYTVGPKTIKGLYKQRLRWVYGFIKNAIDYRDMFFKPSYGYLGMAVLPAAGFSVVSTIYFFFINAWDFLKDLWTRFKVISTIGLTFHWPNFDSFYFNTNVTAFLSIVGIVGLFFIIYVSRKMAGEKTKFGFDSIVFLLLYSIISPFWMMKAVYNVIFARDTHWR